MIYSTIASTVPAIQALRFYPFTKTKPISGRMVARDVNVFVMVDEKGKVYSSQVRSKGKQYPAGSMRVTLTCCVALGLLTKEDLAAQLEAAVKQQAIQDRVYAAEECLNSARTLGLELTPAQQEQLDAALKRVPA